MRRWLRERIGTEIAIPVELRVPLEFHGSEYGGWRIQSQCLTEDSVVYSFGVGEDASFDESLIRRYGCVVRAFDPTPRSIEWVKRAGLGPRFHFEPLALSSEDGTLRLYLPRESGFVSASLAQSDRFSEASFDAPSFKLSTLMQRLGHTHIDVLKMDIEGAEYSVLEQEFGGVAPPAVNQLLIEFHHWMKPFSLRDTQRAIDLLRRVGYRVAWRSDVGHELLFCADRRQKLRTS